MSHRRENAILTCSLVFLALSIFLAFVAHPWLHCVTAPGQRSHALWRASLPGIDMGLDTSPARPGRAGHLSGWIYPHNANEVYFLFRILGAPAVPLRPLRQINHELKETKHGHSFA